MISTKQKLTFLAALFTSAALYAQYVPRQGEWLQFSYSAVRMLNKPTELTEKWNSNAWQLQVMNETYVTATSHFSLGYGLGVSNYYYHTNLRITSNTGGGNLNYAYLPADSSYSRNRLSASYIDIPIEIRYRSNTNTYGRYFRFYAGALIGYRVNSFSHFKTGDYSIKHYHIADLARWHYGVYVRTGFWIFNAFVYYGINPTFETTPSGWEALQDIKSLQLGISICL